MEAPSIAGAEAKLQRAYLHLQELERDPATTANYAHRISFAQHFDPDARTIEATLQGVPDLPTEWSLIAADYLQNVRAALNYLVWELSRWNLLRQGETREPKRITQFPINTVAEEFDAHKLPDLHANHVALIQRLQPSAIDIEVPPGMSPEMYAGLSREQLPGSFFIRRDRRIAAHPLSVLAKLTNEDKHRRLPVALLGNWEGAIRGMPSPRNCTIGHLSWGAMSPHLENGAVWGTVYEVTPLGEGEPELEMKDEISRAEPSIGGLRIADLPAIGGCAEEIIAGFAPLFGE